MFFYFVFKMCDKVIFAVTLVACMLIVAFDANPVERIKRADEPDTMQENGRNVLNETFFPNPSSEKQVL